MKLSERIAIKIDEFLRYGGDTDMDSMVNIIEPIIAHHEEEKKMTDKERGLYRKYRVERLDDVAGKHDDCFYFVLDTTHDPYAFTALKAYAVVCRGEYPELAEDIDVLLTAEESE